MKEVGEKDRGMLIIGLVILIVGGILPFISGISAWLEVGPNMLGCSYDGCIPNTIYPFVLQMLFGPIVVVLGYRSLKGDVGSSSIALSFGVTELIIVGLFSLSLFQWTLPLENLPSPFYLMIWLNVILILVGAFIVSSSGKKNQQEILS